MQCGAKRFSDALEEQLPCPVHGMHDAVCVCCVEGPTWHPCAGPFVTRIIIGLAAGHVLGSCQILDFLGEMPRLLIRHSLVVNTRSLSADELAASG